MEVFIEEDPLSGGDRPALERAIAYCKDHGTRLIIGKIHRMRGGFGWLKRLKDEHVYFMAADVPQINSTEFYRLNWQERDRTDAVSRTIRHALAQSKAEGTALGGKRQNAEGLKLGPAASAVARRQKAKWRSQSTMLKIALLRHRGITTLTGIATRLNQMKHPAPRGGQWSSAQVRAVIKRCEN